MSTARLRLTHGVGFTTGTDGAGSAPPPGSTGTPATGTGGGQKTLAQILAEHPHLAGEIDSRTQSVATREKDQGRRSGVQEWVKGLGVEDPNVVAEAYRKYTEQQAAHMSEAEKTLQDAQAKQAAADAALRDAKQAKFDASAIKWLSLANAEDPAILAPTLQALGVTVDSTDEEIKAAVEALKMRTPGAFTGKPGGTPGAGNPGGPPAGSPGGTGGGEGADVTGQAKAQLERVANRYRGRPR